MKTVDIYKGVLPYIVIQFIMIMVVIAFPSLVMRYKGDVQSTNPNDVKIEIPGFGQNNGMSLPPLGSDGGNGAPAFGLPPLGSDAGSGGQAPALGLPPLNFGGPAPAAPAAPAPAPSMDLSQPPVIK